MQITIITPVYNGAKYIRQCIENVISQDCASVEHLIMDGLSTDGTQAIVNEFAENHPHIRLISEKDKGQSDAMNKGIAAAKGEIISFLNVDDYYEPGVFNRVLEIFKDLPDPSFVCGNLNIWNADGSLKHFNRPIRISLVELVSNCFEWPYNPTAYFYHKNLHEKTGPYNVNNHLRMDYEFILEAANYTEIIHIDELWGNFVLVENSKTQNFHCENPEKAFYEAEELRQKSIGRLSAENRELLNKILANEKPMHVPQETKTLKNQKGIKQKIKSFFNL
jgi:glycosyltransferase involved in cell wall biosynthesis